MINKHLFTILDITWLIFILEGTFCTLQKELEKLFENDCIKWDNFIILVSGIETKKIFVASDMFPKLGPLSNFLSFLDSTSSLAEPAAAAGAEKFFAIKLDNALLLLSSLLVLSNAYTHTMRLHLNASLSSEYPWN